MFRLSQMEPPMTDPTETDAADAEETTETTDEAEASGDEQAGADAAAEAEPAE